MKGRIVRLLILLIFLFPISSYSNLTYIEGFNVYLNHKDTIFRALWVKPMEAVTMPLLWSTLGDLFSMILYV